MIILSVRARLGLPPHELRPARWPYPDKTVLAADDGGGTVTLLALTPPTPGWMRTDPVPLPSRSDRDAFGYGYGGGTPGTTFRALLRCALAEDIEEAPTLAGRYRHNADGSPASQLWHAVHHPGPAAVVVASSAVVGARRSESRRTGVRSRAKELPKGSLTLSCR